jgi:hypothetical protein
MLPPSLTCSRSSLAAVAFVTVVRTAAAEPVTSTPTASLEVQEGKSCGTRADLVARVHARAPRVRLLEERAPLTIRVRFAPLASGQVEGVLVLVQQGAAPVTRRLVASSCAEARDGVALVIAITLGQPVTGDVPDDSSAGSAASATGSDSGAAGTSTTTPAASAKPPTPPPSSSSDERVNRKPASPSADDSELRIFANVAVSAIGGAAPRVMPGATIRVVGELDRASVLSPALALGVTHAWRTGIAATGGKAAFLLDAVELDVCPIALRGGPVTLRPCGSGLMARLSAEGSETLEKPGAVSRPFAALGASLLVAGGFGWVVEPFARASLGGNLVRDSFTFTPVVFHRVSPVNVSGSAGVSLRLR